ncbi:DUF6185 family protein [Streptomyces sp. NPDC048282]|uniref:DUF6185 family protein n=1 Tax=Streptomyces sp. NPDC048282 TaxID=3365528 RepID=UPI003713C16E
MREIRWWRLASLLVAALAAMTWWGCFPAAAHGSSLNNCFTDKLDASTANAEIRLAQHHQSYTKVFSDIRVTVPRGWDLAKSLTYSENSEEYRRAIHCLLLGSNKKMSDNEWRLHNPEVTAMGEWVTVEYNSLTRIEGSGSIRIGPWVFSCANAKKWTVELEPQSFHQIHWKRVEATLDDLNFNDHSTPVASYTDEKTLVWTEPGDREPDIKFDVDLSGRHSFIVASNQPLSGRAGIAAWWVCATIVIALAAFRAQQPSPSTARSAPGAEQRKPKWRVAGMRVVRGDSPAGALFHWSLLSTAVILMLLLGIPLDADKRLRNSFICILAGLALLLVARPWRRGVSPVVTNEETGTDRSTDPDAAQRRQAHAVIVTACAVAAVGMLALLDHNLFGLPKNLASGHAPTVQGVIGLMVLGLATVWLWLAAMVAWAWRFALEGGLVRTAWTKKWDGAPGRCTAVAGVLVAMVAAALLASVWRSSRLQWTRRNWLAEGTGTFNHASYINQFMADFSTTDLRWFFSRSWFLTVIAVLALLYSRVRAQRAEATDKDEQVSLWPGGPDTLLIAALFSFLVGVRGGKTAGSSALYGFWIPLNIISLYGILALGRRRSILGQLGDCFQSNMVTSKKRRRELPGKAQRYRYLNHQLYLLDQGRGGSATRQQLEGELHRLHQWVATGCDGKMPPPEQISVLDIALAWGPTGQWWSNAVRAGRLAFWFGIPASVALTYVDLRDPWDRMQSLYLPTGVPDIVLGFLLNQLAWAGAGFVLGALWRLLPGSSSPVRAWSLVVAYAIPVCVALLLTGITDTNLTEVILYAVLMLSVLTLTSMLMDTVTFKRELDLWPSRFALLLSIYQVRGFSTKIVWLLTQLAAVIKILQDLRRG